ncbi:hypothetical protein Goarm_007100, partial [Gossypium armourianum]|nr:hypothetical protein [Gossypium armourianum]
DGSTIRGWKDSWVPKVSLLFSYVPAHASLDLKSNLRDWVLFGGSWNVDLLHIWLPDDVMKRMILGILKMIFGSLFGNIKAHRKLAIRFWALIIIWVDVRLWRQNFRVFLMEFSFFLNNGYKKVRIQTDNLEVITVLSMEELVDSGITLLRRVKRFLCSNSQRETKYVPKSVI